MAATLTLKAMREPEALGARITGQYLNIPSLLPPALIPQRFRKHHVSPTQNAARGYSFFGAREVEAFATMAGWDDTSPLRSALAPPPVVEAVPHPALLGPDGVEGALPPAFIQVCGMDFLRDDGLVYAAMLEEAGVPVRCEVSGGAPHGHFLWWPGVAPGLAEGVVRDALEGLGWLLGREVSREDLEGVMKC